MKSAFLSFRDIGLIQTALKICNASTCLNQTEVSSASVVIIYHRQAFGLSDFAEFAKKFQYWSSMKVSLLNMK